MLQSPKPRIQRQQQQLRRLTSAPDNPVLEAKQDTQRRVQRPTSSLRQNASINTAQRGSPRKQQHRRNLSVPDNILMSIASASAQGGTHGDYKFYQNTLDDAGCDSMNSASDRRRPMENINTDHAFFLQQMQHGPRTAPIQMEARYSTQQFPDFMQDDSARMIDEIFSFDPSSVTASILGVPPPTRRGSAPLNAPFCNGSTKGHPQRALTFPRDNSNFGSHMQCVSAFDLAPLNHPNYVNLATLSMPLEDDVASFYSPRSNIPSPSFPPVQATADLPPVGLFSVDSTMSSVPEEFTEERVIIKDDPYSEEPFEASDLPELREQGETTPQPTSASNTGISMEEITSFISGPETSDGKWVCKFPECDKRFGRKENIKSHVQTHLGDRQYRCEVCKKCFVRQHDLKRHSKIHTGIKPYPCLCGNSFARHDALTRHRQRGMCIGAFEGIVKKVAKRGRPRKKQLDEDGNELVRPDKISDQEPSLSSASSSASSSSSRSDVSDPRTPTALDCASPSPDSPNFDQYDSSASSTGRSIKEESPELLPSFGSPVDTPPTSPPDSGGFGHFSYKLDAKRSSHGSSFPEEDIYRYREIDYSDFGLPIPEDDVKFGSGSDYSSDFSQGSNAADEYMFSQADGLMFTLTTLEQNPNILGGLGGEDNYIKPELLSNP